MRQLNVSVIVLASACMLAPAAKAADLPAGGPQAFRVDEFVSNWYLRGDVGYQFSASGSDTNAPFIGSQFTDSGTIDFGIGYRAGWLRADVTSTWLFEPWFYGSTTRAQPDVKARMNVIATLFNLYADLGTWYGFTPYIGGGAGFSWMRATEFQSISMPPSASNNSGDFDLSWDLTVGFSYAVSRQFLIDTSYRYLHIGTPKTEMVNFGPLDFGSMDAHEFKTGFRYLID